MVRPETRNEYDAVGRLTASINPNGHVTRFTYDGAGYPIGVIRADGSGTSRVYDKAGRLIESVDANGKLTAFEYDAVGQLRSVTTPSPTEYDYDEAGNLIAQTDARSRRTQFKYDTRGRMVERVLPGGQSETLVYDPAGNVIQQTDFNGNTITFEYDDLNQLTKKVFPDGTAVTFTYTPAGQRETVTDVRGVTIYQYDAQDRLVSRTDPDGRIIEYTYDGMGNRTSVRVPSGTTSYTFDALNRVKTLTNPVGSTTNYFYDAAGNLAKTALPNGTVESREYNELNRLILLKHSDPAGDVFSSFRYTYDAVGNRTSVEEFNGRRVDYAYDDLNRLIGESTFDPVAGNRVIDYIYDAVGNRLLKVDSVEDDTAYTYDANDRLLRETLPGNEVVYTYDSNGNVLSRVKGVTDQVFYEWGVENRLLAADTDGSGIADVQFQYDIDGIRVAKIAGSEETRFLIDANRQFAQVLEEYTPLGVIQTSYVHGNDLVSQNRNGTHSFYHVDGLGSTRALSDESGLLTDRYTYDAFGRTIDQVGSTDNVYLFAGEQRDPATGLDYLRARYMDSATGRFLSRDPLPGDLTAPITLHPYMYAGNNPVNFADPSGEFTLGGLLTSIGIQNNLQSFRGASGVFTFCRFLALFETVETVLQLSPLFIQASFNVNELFNGGGRSGSFVLKHEWKENRRNLLEKVEVKIAFSVLPGGATKGEGEFSIKGRGVPPVKIALQFLPPGNIVNSLAVNVGLDDISLATLEICEQEIGELKWVTSGG